MAMLYHNPAVNPNMCYSAQQQFPMVPLFNHQQPTTTYPQQPLLSPLQQGVVMQQPTGTPWITLPASVFPDCPVGLEPLASLDQILCHQQIDDFKLVTGWDSNNRYVVKNKFGQQIYSAVERTSGCMRVCCGKRSSFIMSIFNNNGQEIMRINRPFNCCGCGWSNLCACCSGYSVFVEAPVGHVIGKVVQKFSFCTYDFQIEDVNGKVHLLVKGPCLAFTCGGEAEFMLLTTEAQKTVGTIKKLWSGLAQECFTDADNFGVMFPMDLDVKLKATVLAALFLIDFMAFED